MEIISSFNKIKEWKFSMFTLMPDKGHSKDQSKK